MAKAGRPSKLSDAKWSELIRRHAGGEKACDLAREFKVSPTQISRRVSQVAQHVKTVAAQLADAETAFESLPITQQHSARTIADQLKTTTANLARAAATASGTTARLHDLAGKALDQFETATDPGEKGKAIGNANGFLEMANTAASVPLRLLAANKESAQGVKTLEDLVVESKTIGEKEKP